MSTRTTRCISQIFFFCMFCWFCIAATLGERWWQLRGWPVNWLLQLDPLIGLGVLLTTGTVYAGLLWGVLTIVLTLFLGRFFCGWLCPFGAVQQFAGYLGARRLKTVAKIQRNRPHRLRVIKYWLLIGLLAAALPGLLRYTLRSAYQPPWFFWIGATVVMALLGVVTFTHAGRPTWKKAVVIICFCAGGIGLDLLFPDSHWLAVSLQTGLLDPLALVHRSINLALLPWLDRPLAVTSALPRYYVQGGLIGVVFMVFVLASLGIPRFYCRFICPLGALFGVLSRWSLWRVGKRTPDCSNCGRCEIDCQGACVPSHSLHHNECLLCMNCIERCPDEKLGFNRQPSAAGEVSRPDLNRRQVVVAAVSGMGTIAMLRLGGSLAGGWNAGLVRPPGALPEADFLARCVKCGQCMRICPTNVIQPAGWEAGLEKLWTPVLDFRLGTSGCQHNCVACSQICPTAALRPLSVAERTGSAPFEQAGPVRIGTAFIDRGRCLPWAMDKPCIVCQENCPVSPKAIFTRTVWQVVRDGEYRVASAQGVQVTAEQAIWRPGQWGTGDFVCRVGKRPPVAVVANTVAGLTLAAGAGASIVPGEILQIMVCLQQPHVDPNRCIGCGVCEHECPVQGLRAIRVTAENESRHRHHRLLL